MWDHSIYCIVKHRGLHIISERSFLHSSNSRRYKDDSKLHPKARRGGSTDVAINSILVSCHVHDLLLPAYHPLRPRIDEERRHSRRGYDRLHQSGYLLDGRRSPRSGHSRQLCVWPPIALCRSELYLKHDYTCLQLTADALTMVQQLYGVIPAITAVGPHSQAVVDMLLQARSAGKLTEVDLPPEIDRLILLDRGMDPVSAFVTPLTYEGMLDEVLGIERGAVTVSEKTLELKGDKMLTIRLNNSDSFFQEMRDYNVVKVARVLAQKVAQVGGRARGKGVRRRGGEGEAAERERVHGRVHGVPAEAPGPAESQAAGADALRRGGERRG